MLSARYLSGAEAQQRRRPPGKTRYTVYVTMCVNIPADTRVTCNRPTALNPAQ